MVDTRPDSEKFDGKSFCVLPFIHLATHPIGTVTPCCITDMTNDMSTAKGKDGHNMFLDQDKLEDIANSDIFKEVRRKMMNNEFPSECKTCYFYEKNGIYSKRIESNYKFGHLIDYAKHSVIDDGTIPELNHKYIELRLGSVCNLACVTCNPFSSTKWNKDVKAFKDTKFENDYFRCDIRTEWYRSQRFYDELLQKCDGLEEVWINGGEPTLIKEHAYFLEKLIEQDRAKDIDLMYTINMTQVPDDFIELWKKFRDVRLHLSIDDLGERNDYIRYGSKFENILSNFKKIVEYKDDFNLEVCQTISVLNVWNIDEFKNFFGNKYGCIIAHNYVHHPSHLHVSLLPQELKEKLTNNLQYLQEDEKMRLYAELMKDPEEETEKSFYEYINILDKQRKLDITQFLPEWKKYF